jgi:hypothetical protein
MNKEFIKMQKLAGLITEGQYKKSLNENEDLEDKFDRRKPAFGILFRKVTPKDDYNDGREYTWIEENVYEFVEYLGYEGQDANDVAGEFMAFDAPGSEGDANSLGLDPETFDPKKATIAMYQDLIYDSYDL